MRKIVGVGVLALVVLLGVVAAVYVWSESFRARVLYGSDTDRPDLGGWTALHRAAADGDVAMLDYLLEQGVDPQARTVLGETAWHIAKQHDCTEAAGFLAAMGVDTALVEMPRLTGPYVGQPMPGEEPELFAPGIVSAHYPAHSPCVFSPSLRTVYWTAGPPPDGGVEMMRMEGPDLRWTRPELTDMKGEPSFSVDGRRLFFLSLEPVSPDERRGTERIWVKERTAEGWSKPEPLGDAVNSKRPHFHHSVDRDGNLYFSDYDTLFYSEYRNGEYREAVDLAVHLGNDTLRGNSPSVSPAGDLILFAAGRGLRGKELCVTFRRADGSWTDRIPLGETINSGRLNDSPRLTPAGNFVFFVSAGNGRPWGIYWFSSRVLDRLKREHLRAGQPPSGIEAPWGSTPRIDGVFSEGEWTDAAVLELSATKKILLKHDVDNLYVALDAPGGDLYFDAGDRVRHLHASFGLVDDEYGLVEGSSFSLLARTPLALHGLQRLPADEIDAAIAQHLASRGWAASLIPMGRPYETEFVVSFDWLGVSTDGADSGVVHLPRMATRHVGGPPHMRPSWPTGLEFDPALETGRTPQDVSFDVARWGDISVRAQDEAPGATTRN